MFKEKFRNLMDKLQSNDDMDTYDNDMNYGNNYNNYAEDNDYNSSYNSAAYNENDYSLDEDNFNFNKKTSFNSAQKQLLITIIQRYKNHLNQVILLLKLLNIKIDDWRFIL